MIKNILLALCLLLFTCKSPENLLKMERLDNYQVNEANFKFLSIKSRVVYLDENNKQNARLNIRIAKDSLIWASVRSTGIEGLRILFTKDSVLIIDRLEKNYYARTFQKLSELLNYDINFGMVQSLIVGSLPVEIPENAKYERKKDVFQKKFGKNDLDVEVQISRFFARLTQLNIKQNGNKLHVDYLNFKSVGDTYFPHECKAIVKYESKKAELRTEITLSHSEIELTDELDFPFSVSESYNSVD